MAPEPAPEPVAEAGPPGHEIDLSVVIPAYNEEDRLGPTLDAVRAHLDGSGQGPWELIVVDDGSTDATRELAAEAAAADPRITLLTAGPGGRNRGKGHALRRGVLASYGRRVLITDADLATPIEELDRLDKELAAGYAAAIGSRAMPGAVIETHQHKLRELLGRAGNFVIRAVAVPGIRDTQCGFKLFDGDSARAAFADSRLDGWTIDVEVLRRLRRQGLPIAEVPVRWAHQEGSKVRPYDYAKVLADLVRLRVRGLRRGDVAITALFLLFSVFLYKNRWLSPSGPSGRYLPDSLQDQNQWEWFFQVTASNVTHLRNPLFTDLQGFPDGVNLMANTVMLGLSVPFTPVTVAFGPAVSLALVMTLGLAATAVAWYWLLRKRLVRRRGAAAVGAALAAFAPPMISHGNAHPNFLVLFMIPLIVDRALRLCDGQRVVRNGVVLGLMATYQIFLGEEPLLLAAMGMLLFAAAYAVVRRDVARAAWRPLGKGLAIAVATALPLVAFPLYWQFFGPQSYHSVLHSGSGKSPANSPLALLSFAARSLAGNAEQADKLALNVTEQNAFYGWPLVALAFAIVVRLWGRPVVKALGFTAVAAAVLSLGAEFRIPLTDVVVPGPWRLLTHQPLFESVIESRVAMICAPVLGALVAIAVDGLRAAARPRALSSNSRRRPKGGRAGGTSRSSEAESGGSWCGDRKAPGRPRGGVTWPLRQRRARACQAPRGRREFDDTAWPRRAAAGAAGLVAVAAALLPIAPTPYPAVDRIPVPDFFTRGTWASYVDTAAGESLVPVPLPDPGNAEPLHWQTEVLHGESAGADGLGFKLPGGYFNGPWGEERIGIYGAAPRHTSNLLRDVRYSGRVPELSRAWQEQARADLAYWKAGAVVLAPQPNDTALRVTVERLLGERPRWVDGVWVWDLGTRGTNPR
ncbi:dolichyl-phosphate beta-glucosyltransferase [Streptomyces sp. NPDC002851]